MVCCCGYLMLLWQTLIACQVAALILSFISSCDSCRRSRICYGNEGVRGETITELRHYLPSITCANHSIACTTIVGYPIVCCTAGIWHTRCLSSGQHWLPLSSSIGTGNHVQYKYRANADTTQYSQILPNTQFRYRSNPNYESTSNRLLSVVQRPFKAFLGRCQTRNKVEQICRSTLSRNKFA